MLNVKGYETLEKIADTGRSVVVRARRERDGTNVVIKSLVTPSPSPEELARFRYGSQLLMNLDIDGVCKADELLGTTERPSVVLQDIGGRSINFVLDDRSFEPAEVLRIGIRVADILGRVHSDGYVHRDIKPGSIVLNEETGEIVLIDFDLATRAVRETTGFTSTEVMVGTLAYMAPEQTGRMNRSVDHRSDLYSLGVSLYEMLCGRRPFVGSDAMGLVYSHLAVAPEPLDRAKGIDSQLSRIVLKLMAKEAEDRYQSAAGLKADLERCLEGLNNDGRIPDFVLGQADVSPSLHLSERLYGREDEVATLLETFERVRDGRTQLLVASGYSGVGKTALVREIYKPVTALRGRYAQGKFNQYQNVPYAALIEAVRGLVVNLLAEPSDVLDAMTGRITEGAGDRLSLIIDVIPEVELLVGPQPPVPELPPTQAKNRFQRTFSTFLQAFADAAHPLVVFLDDLQWADAGSLGLIQGLVLDSERHHIFLIGAYRANEVHEAHPLVRMLADVREAGAQPVEIELSPLDHVSTARLVADTLDCTVDSSEPLAKAIFAKTHGNPFFVERFLIALHDEGALHYESGRWVWDLNALETMAITDNVADLMSAELERLEERALELLTLASFLGDSFDLGSLSVIARSNAALVAGDLWPALERQLISPVGTNYRLMGLDDDMLTPNADDVAYRFVHDRIQEAAYERMAEDGRAAVHLHIARLLSERSGDHTGDEGLFAITNHFNAGRAALEDELQRAEVAQLNLDAGRKAMAATAYPSALEYLRVAREMLPDDAWERVYQLSYDVALLRAEAALMVGEFAESAEILEGALEKAASNADATRIHLLRITHAILNGQFDKTIEVGVEALTLYGLEAPKTVEEWGAAGVREGELLAKALEGVDVPALADGKVMTDPDELLQTEVMARITPIATAVPHTLGFFVNRLVRWSVERGNSMHSPIGYATYGVFMSAGGAYDAADAFGQLALALNAKHENMAVKPAVDMMYGTWICHWKHPYDEAIQYAVDAYLGGLDNGVYDWSGFGQLCIPPLEMARGKPLPIAYEECLEYIAVARNVLKFADAENSSRAGAYVMLSLMGRTRERDALDAEGHDFDSVMERMIGHYPMAVGWSRALRLMSSYILGDLEAAMADTELDDLVNVLGGGLVSRKIYAFYRGMTFAAVAANTADAAARAELVEKVDAQVADLARFAEANPGNSAAEHLLLVAERAALEPDADTLDVVAKYDAAIDAAIDSELVHIEAIACERAGCYLKDLGHRRSGRGCLADAHGAYVRWGADGKVNKLEGEYGFLRRGPNSLGVSITSHSDSGKILRTLDASAIVRANLAIAREIVLKDLLVQLMNVTIEHAGAQRGSLMLLRDGELRIEAQVEAGGITSSVLQSLPLSEELVPTAVIRSVARQTTKTMVLDDAVADQRLQDSDYARANKPRSVLCMPVMNQGRLVAVLYLENNLATHVFTADRVAMIELISTQAAVSLHNARLYEGMERVTEAQSRFVPYQFLESLKRRDIARVEVGEHVAKEMSVLFSDLRKFMPLAQGLGPKRTIELLNRYFGDMAPVIAQHGGFIDSYSGDEIMALFDVEPDQAVQAGIALHGALVDFNRRATEAGEPTVRMGVGINTGELVLGTLGSADRIKCGVVGDSVNLASRLEQLTKRYEAPMLIGEDTYVRLRDPNAFSIRLIDKAAVHGREKGVKIYEVLDAETPERRAAKEASAEKFQEAIRLYWNRDFPGALAALGRCIEKAPRDRMPRIFLERCTRYLGEPPPVDWDGVEKLTHK